MQTERLGVWMLVYKSCIADTPPRCKSPVRELNLQKTHNGRHADVLPKRLQNSCRAANFRNTDGDLAHRAVEPYLDIAR